MVDRDLQVMMSQAKQIVPRKEPESNNPESIYKQKAYTLEVRYGYIDGLQLTIARLRLDFEGKTEQEIQSMHISSGYAALSGRLQALASQLDESLNLEDKMKGICQFNADQRRQIMIEICYTVKKMFEVKKIEADIQILDNFYATRVTPA